MRIALGRQICLDRADNDKVLYVVTISDNLENMLEQNVKRVAGETVLGISSEQENNLIRAAFIKLTATNRQIEEKTVILCRAINRLPLYRLLEKKIPSIQIISYSELVPDIYVEEIDKIELPTD